MSKTLIILGVIFIIAGVLWPFLKLLHIGQLPGDLVLKKGNVSVYFPIVSCILISIILSIIFWFINRK